MKAANPARVRPGRLGACDAGVRRTRVRHGSMRALLAGFAATFIFTFSMYVVSTLLSGWPVDFVGTLGRLLGTSWSAALLIHLFVGAILLPALYVRLVDPMLAGTPAARGVTWGVMLWLGSQAILLPLSGGGFFSAASGGAVAALDSLIGHAAYGMTFGVLWGGLREAPRARRGRYTPAMHFRRAA